MFARPWCLLLLLCFAGPGVAGAASADSAYHAAAKAYYGLKGDPAQRKFRHSWLKVAKQFEQVAAKHPRSEKAAEALFTAAELFSDLSRISLQDEDVRSAVANYEKLLELKPGHRLTDDAAVAVAKLYLERLNQPERAQRVLSKAARLPSGDRLAEVRSLLASLPSSSTASRKAAEEDSERSDEADGNTGESLADSKHARARLKGMARSKSDEYTLAQQLGLKFRRVVIDAGHGGHDSGAVGRTGLREKDVALAISKHVAARLKEEGLEVVLTRKNDRFVRLEDRARIANRARGDLFLSIHCNSARNRNQRGIETYTLNTASDRYSIRLAARENSSSEKGMSDLRFILADLATKTQTAESVQLATKIQKSLVGSLSSRYPGVRDLGTKEALFYVLLGAQMPAVLVETSFLSNPEEERRLRSEKYQRAVAEAIAKGVQDFLGYRERVARAEGR